MGVFGRLDIEDLAHAEDVGELLRRLESSPYADIVRPARRAFEESHDPFILDAALDRSYYEGLEHRALPLENVAGQSFRRLMSSLIDRLNLVWLLRYRFNYNLPPAQVYYLLVASRYSAVFVAIAKTGGARQPARSAFRACRNHCADCWRA